MLDMQSLNRLNLKTPVERLTALKALVKNTAFPEPVPRYINNHIHTIYSFSPYSPSAAAYFCKTAGLSTAGIMDHDSLAGASEFIAAGALLNLPVTVGLECRAHVTGTQFEQRTLNNPEQPGSCYMALHAVPRNKIEEAQAYFAPLRKARNKRNRLMLRAMNSQLFQSGIYLDFNNDILPLSEYKNGGSITERHLLFALSKKLIKTFKRGKTLIAKLHNLNINPSPALCSLLIDEENPFYEYDLLGVLKAEFLQRIYIPATDECLHLNELTAFAQSIGAVLAYAYLGDVEESVTGDKRQQKFEDAFLEELFEYLSKSGVRAITYMPSRNTKAQLKRLRALCGEYELLEISGEDINSPRQKFISSAMDNPDFSNLVEAAWALIAHELGEKDIYTTKRSI